jgi:transcriptional regulator with XRE-family HTH domain
MRLNHEPDALRWAREKAGLTQTALAERTGLARTLIVEIEGGTRNATPENLLKLAEALNCPVVVLERKREPTATQATADPVPELRHEKRADTPDVQAVRERPVDREAS